MQGERLIRRWFLFDISYSDFQLLDEQLSLLCHIPGHIEKGMVGRVELRDLESSV